jgi:hypothetical protein
MRRDTTDQPGERCSLRLFVQTIPFLGRLVDMYPAKMHPRTLAPAMHKVETLHLMAAEGLARRGWSQMAKMNHLGRTDWTLLTLWLSLILVGEGLKSKNRWNS